MYLNLFGRHVAKKEIIFFQVISCEFFALFLKNYKNMSEMDEKWSKIIQDSENGIEFDFQNGMPNSMGFSPRYPFYDQQHQQQANNVPKNETTSSVSSPSPLSNGSTINQQQNRHQNGKFDDFFKWS